MFVKVCGLKEKEQIDHAIELGYNAIGVVTYPKSKRYCTDNTALELAEYASGRIITFVVGMQYSDVAAVEKAFDYVQIYEAKPMANLAYSSSRKPPKNLDFKYFIYDASIGSGKFESFPDWLENFSGNLILAGGLTPENVRQVISTIKPFGVDVSSGVEKNGIKNVELMQSFINAVRNPE